MMGTLGDYNTVYAEMRMREMRAMAQEAHRARQAYQPRRLRRRVGRALISAGQNLMA